MSEKLKDWRTFHIIEIDMRDKEIIVLCSFSDEDDCMIEMDFLEQIRVECDYKPGIDYSLALLEGEL